MKACRARSNCHCHSGGLPFAPTALLACTAGVLGIPTATVAKGPRTWVALYAVSEFARPLTADGEVPGSRGAAGLLPIQTLLCTHRKLVSQGWSVLVKTLILVSTLHLRILSSSLGAEPNCLFFGVKESCVETCQIYSHGAPSHAHCRQVWAAAQFPCP